MLVLGGSALLGLALASALVACCALFRFAVRGGPLGLARLGRWAVTTGTLLLAAACALLVGALLADQFGVRYAALHSARALPVYLKFSALWAGQEGSLLLWSLLQAGAAALVANARGDRHPLGAWAGAYLTVIATFFIALTFLLANPFVASAPVPPDGQGLHPLLRHVAMALHPPVLYLGYVGLAVPFALALAALTTGRTDAFSKAARAWTLGAWGFLGFGLLLGARWAYDVLGWGGYWGWDPVENGGLMPWLVATALLHGLRLHGQRAGFRLLNIGLAALAYGLVIFGSLTTRSGWVDSVHAFSRSTLGLPYLAFLLLVVAVPVGLIVRCKRRWPAALAGLVLAGRLFSAEGTALLTMELLLTTTASVFIGTVLPTLTGMLSGKRLEAGPAWFDRVTGPQFALLVVLMGVCPLTRHVLAALRRPRLRALSAVAAAALVHGGVLLIAVAVVGTRAFASERTVTLALGEEVALGRTTLVVEALNQMPRADHIATTALVHVYEGGKRVATLTPRVDQYSGLSQTVAVPAVRPALREDLYVLLAGWEEGGDPVVLRVLIHPLAALLWWGGLAVVVGGLAALWPLAPLCGDHALPSERRQRALARAALVALMAGGIGAWAVLWMGAFR